MVTVPVPARKAIFWLLLAGVAIGSLMPVDYLPRQVFDLWDKAQHALGFVLLAWSGHWAYCPPGTLGAVGAVGMRRPVVLALGLLLFGAAIEIAQSVTGWRHGDGLDLLADAVGLVFGLVTAQRSRAAREAAK